jgi:membrane-associated phospholipid phosphatase
MSGAVGGISAVGRRVRVPVARLRATVLWETLSSSIFLGWLRWCAVAVWTVALGVQCQRHGVPLDREGLGGWIVAGLICGTIGKRAAWTALLDWLPFLAVLVAYDYLRGAADTMGMPTWWSPQLDADKFLFGGTVPTVWLQEHFRYPDVRWWDVGATLCYVSFFLAPYLLAGVLWLRSRTEFRRWALRFVTLSFVGFGLFALFPAAPPWAAASCTPAQVAGHPSAPSCLGQGTRGVPGGGLLGTLAHPRPGSSHYVQRISSRGWSELHLGVARSLLDEGQRVIDVVAAVPSLHAGGTLLIVLFLWRRSRVWLRALLVGYALAMALALVYTAEHYVSDILAGWLCAVLVTVLFGRLESRSVLAVADTLGGQTSPTASRMETPCPQIAMTPSSISPSDGGSSTRPARSTVAAARPGTTARSASS